jgi:hypothetical protein
MPRYLVVSVLGYLRMMLYQSSSIDINSPRNHWIQLSELSQSFEQCTRCSQMCTSAQPLSCTARATYLASSGIPLALNPPNGSRMESQVGFTRGKQPMAPSSPIRCLQLSATAQCSNLAMASSQFLLGKKIDGCFVHHFFKGP